MTESQVLQYFQDGAGLERLLQDRQHLQTVLLADAFDMLEDRGAASAHELHVAGVTVPAERDDAFDRFGGFERNVEEHQVGGAAGERRAEGRAVGEFLGVDAAAVEDERQEMADAAVDVGDKAERGALLVAALFGVALGRSGGHGFRRRRSCAHCQACAQGGKRNIGRNILTAGFACAPMRRIGRRLEARPQGQEGSAADAAGGSEITRSREAIARDVRAICDWCGVGAMT
jgi:hypothetical protein